MMIYNLCYRNNKPLSNIDIYKQKMLNFSKTFTKTKKNYNDRTFQMKYSK